MSGGASVIRGRAGAIALGLVVSSSAFCWLGAQASAPLTRGQIALFGSLCVLFAVWAAAEADNRWWLAETGGYESVPGKEQPQGAASGGGAAAVATVVGNPQDSGAAQVGDAEAPGGQLEGQSQACAKVACPPPALLGAVTIEQWRALPQLAGMVFFLFLCDRTDFFATGPKQYDPSSFWGCWAVVCCAALATTKTLATDKPMQREQTDEWKGWMQIMFLMYHYFQETEVYNAIRIYIACYVWMTGYGNFFLYSKGKSFTLRRTLQMLFRLNFMGAIACVALTNEFMLYYICAMHTFFTVIVALALYVRHDLNASSKAMYVKIAITLVITFAIYDGPSSVFSAIFGTLPLVRPLFAFHDPLHPEVTDEMHEWYFRSGLDRFIWIFGMWFALEVKQFERVVMFPEGLKSMSGRCVGRLLVVAAAALVFVIWGLTVFSKEKYAYNRFHPFTSFIPIAAFLVLRNSIPFLRQRYLWLFAYLGKTTLETYIFQFHIWMHTTGANGSPKKLMVWVPGSYWANFIVVSIVYLWLSARMFDVTVKIRDALIPPGTRDIALRCGAVAALLAGSWLAAGLAHNGA